MIAIASVAAMASAQPVVIDGVYDPAEWSSATVYPLTVNLPGGGTTSGALFLWNDSRNLYAGVVYKRTTLDAGTSVEFDFDSPATDGAISYGDDAVVLIAWSGCPAGKTFYDDFRSSRPPCNPGFPCGVFDTDDGGTSDGNGAVGNDGKYSVHELWHPLASADVAHDIQAGPGMTLPFTLTITLGNGSGAPAETYYPGPWWGGILDTYFVR
jgi:hypothetical protein